MYKGNKLSKATKGSAGYDIKTPNAFTANPGVNRIPTGIFLELSPGTYGQLASRSSLAAKGLTVEGGVIDSDYRGEIGVILYNHTCESVKFEAGDRIAQLLIIKIADEDLIESEADLTETIRGTGGFGSTGR